MIFSKIIALIKILIENKGQKFSLVAINETSESIYATFEEIATRKIYKQKLDVILSKKKLLTQFNSSDACKIGYAHGKYLSYLGKAQNEQNKPVSNGFSLYNNKTFC